MNRLTKKDRYGHFYTNKALCRNIHSSDGERLEGVFFKNQVLAIDGEPITKLGQLEDIEEELGIDLITLFKALKNGFYTKSNNGIKFWKEDDKHFVYVRDLKYDIEICCEECENVIGAVPTMFLERSTKDYGKTWALSREELENENQNKTN